VTAREYYELLLRQGGHLVRERLSDDECLALAKRHRKMYPNLNEDELFRYYKSKSEEGNPANKLKPFFDDIVKNVPPKLNRAMPDVFAGEFPTKTINGSVRKVPGGGFLILANWGLSKTMHEWAKLAINIFALAFNNPEFLSPDDTFENTIALMKESLKAYLSSNQLPSFPQYANDIKGHFSSMLGVAAVQFVLAHEYAHILAGHLDKEDGLKTEQRRLKLGARLKGLFLAFITRKQKYDDLPELAPHINFEHKTHDGIKLSWAQELEADRLAVSLLLHNADRRPASETRTRLMPIENTIAGIIFFFAILRMMELFQVSGLSASHPLTMIRWQKMQALIEAKVDLSSYSYLRMIDSAIVRMARSIGAF
jgi:Peptidase family M48